MAPAPAVGDPRRHLAGAFAVLACLSAVIAVFHSTFADMAAIWLRSETFAHGVAVLPLFAYLVWSRRDQLGRVSLSPWWPALLLMIPVALLWLLGQLASALTPAFFAAVGMIPLSVAAVLGLGVVRALAFPLALLFFAVPFGEVFVPTLINWTADFTVAALLLSGVPVYREGQNLVVPNGHWVVVDACSGIRYLLASVFCGTIYAMTLYRLPLRRTLFIGASVVVPIVANWLRAYGIVLIGHLSDNRLAAGVDHLIYGWIFFGLVIGGLFLIGSRWREDDTEEDRALGPAVSHPARAVRPIASAALTALAIALCAMLVERWLDAPRTFGQAPDLKVEARAGWQQVPVPATDWRPRLLGPQAVQVLTFARGSERVTVIVGLYRGQRQGAELVNSSNALVPDDSPDRLLAVGNRDVIGGQTGTLTVRTALIQFRDQRLAVAHWYWLKHAATSSDTLAKLDLAVDRLLRRDDASAWIAVAAVDDRERGDKAVAAFLSDMAEQLHVGISRLAETWQ